MGIKLSLEERMSMKEFFRTRKITYEWLSSYLGKSPGSICQYLNGGMLMPEDVYTQMDRLIKKLERFQSMAKVFVAVSDQQGVLQ